MSELGHPSPEELRAMYAHPTDEETPAGDAQTANESRLDEKAVAAEAAKIIKETLEGLPYWY